MILLFRSHIVRQTKTALPFPSILQMVQDADVHPMVPVPEAIRTVIRETGRVLLEHPHSSLTVSSEAAWNDILDRVLDKDVTMNEPGYPPYNASIMDGFAI